ncbi:alpha/beta hydrolase [Paenibacillus qinlingensis]|uniref:Acetyl esterase/lipase n=1 Tax=Paenibacillus qinlingensis TaxID=1837343 RepID=A0ABU1NTJ6_9BACL|nr:alpha/beta hydrolase [Paenibacillus qinlingensis]MDR6550784.1 acetyl esterase/lipase [Paenibacillus qinlingensis]
MLNQTINLWTKEEYTYDTGTDFIPTLTTYILDGLYAKDAVLVIPGGGYKGCSSAEAEGVAMKFLEAGKSAFVLTYTTRLRPSMQPVQKQALRDLSRAMILIRENAEKWRIHPDHIAICGFSAGGHLAASLAVHWNRDFLQNVRGIQANSNKPNAVILGYPVISTGEFVHKGSFVNLLGDDATKEQLDEVSLEHSVGPHTPPVFLWHTIQDMTVPVENAMIFASALRKSLVPFELHIFPFIGHGTSTSDDSWYTNGQDYLNADCAQLYRKVAIKELTESKGNSSVSDAELLDFFNEPAVKPKKPLPDPMNYQHNANWMKLCIEWLNITFRE